MAVYRKDWAQPQAGTQGFAQTKKMFGRRINLSTTDLGTINNTVGAFVVPRGFTVTGIIFVNTDMDSSTGLTISVGDAASANRYLSAQTGQAAGTTQTLASTGLLFANTADTEILLTMTAAATTAVAGTVDLYLDGFVT